MLHVRLSRALSSLILAALLLVAPLGPTWAEAPLDPLAAFTPAQIKAAQDGDARQAHQIGMAVMGLMQEADLRAALPWLRIAYAQSEALLAEDPFFAGNAALTLSRALAGLSQFSKALDLAVEAEARFRASTGFVEPLNSAYATAVAIEDQANLLNGLSRYPDAIDRFQTARALYEALGEGFERNVANVLLGQGISHEGASELDAALQAYGEALTTFRELDGDQGFEVGALCNNIGWVLIRQKEFSDARQWLEWAREILTDEVGEYSEAVTSIRINLGLVALEEGLPDEAIRWGMKAMPYLTANRAQTLDDQRWNFEMMSRAFALRGESERAIFFGKMAVNAQQEFRSTNTVRGSDDVEASQREWHRLYRSLADLLIADGRISEAQAVLNMEKEEEVFEFLKRDIKAKLSDTRALLTPHEETQQGQLVALSAQPISAERELRSLILRLDAGEATEAEEARIEVLETALQEAADAFDAEVDAFLAAVEPEARDTLDKQFDAVGSYQAVLETLDRPTAILQVAALDDSTHLFLTLPGVTLHEQVAIPRADLAHRVFDALEAIAAIAPDAQDKLAALHSVLFAPIEAALRESGTEVVMLNLDGFLRYVPFAALYDGTGYLVERYAFTLYSPAVPTQFAAAARQPAATAGFGVTEAHEGFSALPGVAAELTTIFAPGTGVLSGETALDAGFDESSLKRVLRHKPAILHIASHFSLLPGREDDSFLLLGDGSHLPLSKIRSTRALRFQGVDLLTLSACQTARGGDGAEIDGFGATAQLNGAGAVMASLWPVSDAATPRLMHDFYAGMMQGGLDKAEALRRAQVAMLKGNDAAERLAARSAETMEPAPAAPVRGFSHPYFWSAFVLMGNWL